MAPSTMQSRHDRYLSTRDLETGLRKRAVRGGTVTMASQAIRFMLQLGSTAVLARLLTPEDFGLIAMVAVVTGFLNMFKDMGLSMATIQRAEINHAQVSTLFWINVAMGATILLVLVLLAPLVAWFFSEPRLVGITAALGAAFFFGGLGVQHEALMKRRMRFTALATIDLSALAVAIVAAILMARAGYGYWALVALQVVAAVAATIGLWLLCGWRPGRPRRRAGVRPMIGYGANLTGANALIYFRRNLDNLLIGRFVGSQALGLYAKAYQLLMLPIQQVNSPVARVAVPTLSRLQAEPARYREYFRHGILLIVSIGMPVVVLLFVAAHEVVLTVLGDQWLAAVDIFRLLAPAAFVGTFNVASGWVYASFGHTHRQLRWGAVMFVVTVAGLAIGLRWGVAGVAASISITSVLFRYPGLAYCFRDTPVTMRDLGAAIWLPSAAAFMAGAATWLLRSSAPLPDAAPVSLLVQTAFYAVTYMLSWAILPNGLATLRGIVRLMSDLRARRAPSTPEPQ